MVNRWSPTTKRAVVALSLLAVASIVVAAREVIEPFVWAGIFAYVFSPLVGAVQRRSRLPRLVIAAALYAVLAFGVYSLARALVPIVVDQVAELQRGLPRLIENVEAIVVRSLEGTGFEPIAITAFGQATDIGQMISGRVVPFAVGAFGSLLKTLVFVIALWYLLLDGPKLGSSLQVHVPPGPRDEARRLLGRINSVLGQYVRGQVVLIAIMSTATTIGLSVLHVPFSLLLGLLTGVLEVIPIVGPITAGTIAVLVALGHSPAPFGWTQVGYAGVVAVMYTVLRHAEDYFVIPLVIGRIVELHPLVVIFSVLVGGAIGGLLGVVLAVPIAAMLRLVTLYTLAKLRDEDPYAAIAETVPVGEAAVAGPTRRPA